MPEPFYDISISSDSGGCFESFAQQFLEVQGLVTIEPASRGTDGGRDLIMAEKFTTKLNREIDYRWLVSSKFRAGGRTISPSDEQMIIDRLQRHNCNGFIGFYSTAPSTNLADHLRALSSTKVAQVHMFDYVIFDGNGILSRLNRDIPAFAAVMQTFMPTYLAELSANGSNNDAFNLTGVGT